MIILKVCTSVCNFWTRGVMSWFHQQNFQEISFSSSFSKICHSRKKNRTEAEVVMNGGTCGANARQRKREIDWGMGDATEGGKCKEVEARHGKVAEANCVRNEVRQRKCRVEARQGVWQRRGGGEVYSRCNRGDMGLMRNQGRSEVRVEVDVAKQCRGKFW